MYMQPGTCAAGYEGNTELLHRHPLNPESGLELMSNITDKNQNIMEPGQITVISITVV
jgi:hypothetical protein